ncbi:pickpocket protein 28-like [Hermetia illucens]|uniref:pickpocket protein 28-like n=1 Tax=Hermetia illucens TaxID=343691 RepID=UPI0018CC6B66|nr:pickpocket protein 28-like [Hermetia illucens]
MLSTIRAETNLTIFPALNLVNRLKFRKTASPIDVLEVMASLAPTINYTVPFLKFNVCIFFPDGYFTTVFTDLGVCHQFNGIHQSELLRYPSFENFTFAGEVQKKSTWSLSEGYAKNTDEETVYPQRARISGKKGGIFLAIQGLLADIDYLCRGAVEGFSLQLLAPDEFPAAHKQYIRGSFGKDVGMIIKPSLITTSDNLRDSPWQSRHCFFADERYLRFFKTYSQDKCAFECLTNYTYAKCNCVKFSMPHTKDMPICQAADIPCYYQAEDDLLRNEFEFELSGKSKDFTSCNCLPACTSLKYEVEIGETKLYYEELLRALRDTDYMIENSGLQMGRFSIYFRHQNFIGIQRSMLYSTTDFLASCGGLLGLFLGMTVLSFVEIFYFFTMRLIANLRLRWKSPEFKLYIE